MADKIGTIPANWKQTYKDLPDGSTKTREWVELIRPGDQFRSSTWIEVTEKVKQAQGWETIEPYYANWKKGIEAPVVGTPLGAWPGITNEEAAAFKAAGLQSVEHVAEMTDRVRSLIRLPNVMRLKEEAAMFLKAKDQKGVELQLKAQAEQIAALQAMLAEQNDDGEPAPKRRGRPPKADGHILDVRQTPAEQEDEAA